MTGDTRKRTFGLAAILIVGTIAGFLAAAGTGGANYATVGTISDSQAFQMPVHEEDQRVRFALEADQATSNEPVASFALYDPSDDFFTEFELTGDGDDAEAILDDAGPWVLFVTERRNADLAVQYEAEDEDTSQVELQELDVEEERTVIAEQDGGSLDEQLAFRLDTRPASVFLEYTGDIAGLDATVASEEGPVYDLSDASANSTQDGDTRNGDVTVTSANLVAGTYEIEATADAFDGELAFVHQTFERTATIEPTSTEEEVQTNVTSYEEAHEGAIVAEIQEGEAFEVRTGQASQLAFLASPETSAELMVYNGSDRLVQTVEIEGEDHHHDYDWHDEDEENQSEQQANQTVRTLEDLEEGPYVVYVEHIRPDEGAIDVFVADEDAPEAQPLDVEKQKTTLEGNEASWNTTLDGALLGIHAWTRDAASMDRNVSITGEAGPVLYYEQAFNSFGIAMHDEYEVYHENFTDGDLEVSMGADGFGGETRIEIVNYVR